MAHGSTVDGRPRRAELLVVLLVALGLRLAWGLAQPRDETSLERLPDQREYLELGRNLLHGRGLRFTDPRFADEVVAYRTPGYPLLVAACGGRVRAVRVAQAVIDTTTVLAIYLLARRWLGRGPSLLAAAAVALNPLLIYFTGLLLSETLFTAMLAWGMVLLVRPPAAGQQPRGWGATLLWLAGGLMLAASVLVRQSAIGLPLLLSIAAALVNRRSGVPYHRRWPLPVGATALLLTFVVLLPWAWRNERLLGAWVWTSTNGGITLYDGLNPDATGASDQSFVQSMPGLRSMDEVGRSEYLSDSARQFAREHPRRVIELALVKAARTWSPVPLSADYGGWRYRAAGLLYTLPLFVLALAGLVKPTPLPRAAKVMLSIPAIYFTAVHMLTVGSLRYRLPVEPPMAVVAASALALPAAAWKRAGGGPRPQEGAAAD